MPPIPSVIAVHPAPSVPTQQAFCHHGFALEIRCAGSRYAYAILQDGLLLHASRADFATVVAADRAARCFVDDALASFEFATQALVA